MRRAVREDAKGGAQQIKVMAGGGVATPSYLIDMVQYTEEEIRAAVEEAKSAADLCIRPCLYSGGDPARGPGGRALHRARQPDRRRLGASHGGTRVLTLCRPS